MPGPDLRTYTGYHLTARRVEVALVAVSAALAALMWQLSVPEIFPRPGLPPERSVQLFSALVATCAVALLRPVSPPLEASAVVSVAARRAALLTVVLAWTAAVTVAGALAMEDDLGWQHARNVAVYLGLVLALRPVVPTLSWVAPWGWLSACLIAGHRLVPGDVPTLRGWAYPLEPADHLPLVAVALLVLGGLVFTLVPPRQSAPSD